MSNPSASTNCRFPAVGAMRYNRIMWLALLVYVVLSLALVAVTHALMFRPKCRDLEYTKQYALEHQEIDGAFLALDWREWSFESPQGYTLRGQYLQGKPGMPAALFVHGITWTRYGMAKYMRPFIERGWSVAAFDLAGHGESAAPRRFHPSYGFYEKFDVAAGVAGMRALFPDRPLYGLFGESLGAASALEYAPLAGHGPERQVDFIVADCPFSSAWDELLWQYHTLHVPNFLAWPSAQLTRLLERMLHGFDIAQASPAQAATQTDMPILFAHGMDDNYVPTIMSVRMASARLARGIGPTELVLIPGATHAKGILTDRARWLASVLPFIESVAERPHHQRAG